MLSLFYCRLTLPVRHNCPPKVQLYDFNRHKTDERKCQVAQKVPRWCKVSCYVSQKVLNCEKSAWSFRNKMTIKERPFGSDLQQIYKSKKYKNGTRNLFRSSRNQHGLRVSSIILVIQNPAHLKRTMSHGSFAVAPVIWPI